MRWSLTLASFCCIAVASVNPQLQQVHNVYILPMGNSMDQFLANRLARMGGILVVTDPKSADAILTDRLGQPFEKKLNELYPAAPPEDEDEDADDDSSKKDDSAKKKQDTNQERITSFGRGRGTFFLVDRKTRNVVWSVYERPKNSSPDELNKSAQRVVDRLKHDLKPAPATQPN